ncbi:MAG: DUF5305 family protein, partial [Sedimentibacter sp.]
AIDYKVNIIENAVYDTTVLPSDSTYITALINNIDINFKHMFEGDSISDIEGNYNIMASVTGKIGGQTGNILWTKNYELKPATKFNTSSTTCEINDKVIIDYNLYNNVSKELNSLTGVSTNDTLNISMNVNYSAKTDEGIVEEKFSPALSIPLNSTYFNIERLNIEEKTGEIKNVVNVTEPPSILKIIIFRIAIGILIILTLILIFFSDEPSYDEIYKKKINKIFKTHGSRLVAINSELTLFKENHHNVHNIDDLVKIADELEKPIMYIYNANICEMDSFYVVDSNDSYAYTVSYPNILGKVKI